MNCQLCNRPGVDNMEFHTGNNCEYKINIALCQPHMHECEAMGPRFETKYAQQILDALVDDHSG